MTKHLIERTGLAPLQFNGVLIADQTGNMHRGKQRERWTNLYLYRTDEGQHVLHGEFYSDWPGESAVKWAQVVDDFTEVMALLQEHNPAKMAGIGYPNGVQFMGKQKRLMEQLEADYADRVGAILHSAGEVFAEKIY